jgi:hypothetical protein
VWKVEQKEGIAMTDTTVPFGSFLGASTLYVPVPGPDRKRSVKPYRYRVTYCSADPDEAGCAVAWEVVGGRVSYQVALERQTNGDLRWHCTCADAIYRGDDGVHQCKHVKGLLGLGRGDVAA